jgi:peptidoglycan-binding domain 1 protein
MKRRIEMKKLMAIILTLAMVMSLCVVPASAAGSGVAITITPDKSSVDTATGDAVVTYTVKAKVTDPNLKVGAMTIILDPGTGLKLAEETKKKNPDFYYQANAAKYQYNEETNDTGIFETVFNYAPKTKTFVASGTTNDRNLNSTHGEIVLMTIMGKIAKGTTGSVTLGASTANYGDPSGEASSIVNCDVPPATVTITKAPIDSVTASVETPVAGQALDFTGTVGSSAPYSISKVEWFEGTNVGSDTSVTDPTTAKAKQYYFARITLTAKSGETFAESLDDTMSGDYLVTRNSDKVLYLTHSFPATGSNPAASVTDAPKANTDLKYNGGEQDLLSFKGNASGGDMQYSLDNSSWSTAIPKGKNAGDYTVYYMVKGDSTHSDYTPTSNTVTVKIDPKGIYDSTVTIDPIPNQTYTGNAIEPPLVVKDGGTVLKKDKDYTVSYPINNTNAGLASLQVNGMGNYTGTKGESFNIDRADQKLTVPGSVEVPFGTTKDLKTVCSSNAPGVTLQFALAPGASMPSGTSFDAANGTVTAGNNTGAFDVTVNSAAVTNYNAALQKTITVKIVAKTPSVYTEEPKAETGLKYNGDEQALVTAGAANGGTVKYSLDGTTWIGTVPTGKDAKTYTVHYKIEGDAAHSDSTPKTHTVTIDPREVTVAAGDYKVSKKYDGTTTAGTGNGALSVTGIVDSGVSVKATPVAYTSPDVGGQSTMDVAITLDGTGKGNYKIKDGATTISVPCEITPATLTVTPNAGQSKKFGAEDPTLHSTTSGKVSSQIPDYTGALGRAEGEAVGQYDITLGTLALIDHFSSGFKASNYELKMASPAVKFEITKADAPTLPDITHNQKYNVTTGEKAIVAVMPDDAGTLTYAKGTTESKTGSVTIDSWNVDTTTGKVTYKLSNGAVGDTVTLPVTIKSTNYADATVNVVITLIKGSSGGYYYAPTAAVVPDMPMLYRGCTGDAVKTLQDKLNALGYNSGSVDGIFGAKTYAAVTAFQKANSLGVDGIVGKLTWGKIYGVSPAMPVETTTVVGRPTVSYGSRGDAVRKLQELLNALGYDCGSVDGIFGSKTKAAVLAFQKANGLGVDGIVGPLTWAKLG